MPSNHEKSILLLYPFYLGIQITTDNLEIHHIEPLAVKWEKRLQNDNLITLCCQCHRIIDIKNNGKLDFEFERKEEEYEFEFR